MSNRYGLNRRTRELDIRSKSRFSPMIIPCCLCGEDVLHGAVEGRDAETAFRAQEDAFDVVWVPLKGHAHPVDCPDPEVETEKFWHNRERRDAYKAQRRREADRRRVN